MSVHTTVNVWDRKANTWRFWCMDCQREGNFRSSELEATRDAADHVVRATR